MKASSIPGALDGLYALATRVLPEVQVWDGAPSGDLADDMVFVGWSGDDEDDTVVESTRTRDQVTTDPDHESYTITNIAYSWPGDGAEAKTARDRVYGFVNAIASELAADPTMGGVVGRAMLTTEAFAQSQTERGAAAAVRFTVSVDAWTR